MGHFQFRAHWSVWISFHFCVHFVCHLTDSFVHLLSASDWLLCVFILVYDLEFCALTFVCCPQFCVFVCDFQFSRFNFACELNFLPLSLTVIKTFSFASSCSCEIFQFFDIILHYKFHFFGSIFVSEFYSMFFCLRL